MMSRRRLLGLLGTGLMARFVPSSVAVPLTTRQAKARPRHRVTTISYNVLKCTGWPPKLAAKRLGDVKKQIPERLVLELAAYNPDIINFSEAPTESVVRGIAERLGMKYAFFRSGEDWPGAILTRYEILEHRNCPLVKGPRPRPLFTRHWGRAVLNTRGPFGELVVHSAHLRPVNPAVRRLEVLEIVKAIEPDVQAGRAVILQGDLNHSPKWPSYKLWVNAGLTDTQAAVGNGDQPSINARRPRLRIDYIWAAGPIARHLTDARVLFEGAFRTNPADRSSFALSDHLPVLARFEQ